MKILTIAVPSYNMENHLLKNLNTYCDEELKESLEVIILDNASTDGTSKIANAYTNQYPEIFRLISRSSRGYGSSINEAIREAKGLYFRIVDADDWVETTELLKLIQDLKTCNSDIVQTHYQTVHMVTNARHDIFMKEVIFGYEYTDFNTCHTNVPCIHSIIYRTSLLKDSKVTLQDGIFFVDEEYVIMPFLYAKTITYYPYNIYRYLIGNPAQSTSPVNRGKYFHHREMIVKRLIDFFNTMDMHENIREYCFFRISQAAGDHLTTLYLYLPNYKDGRKIAKEWLLYLKEAETKIYNSVRKKAVILNILNRIHLKVIVYNELKKLRRYLCCKL